MSMSLRLRTVSDIDIRDIEKEPLRLGILHSGEILDPSILDDLEPLEKEQIINWFPKTKSEIFYIEGMFQSLHYLLTSETEWGTGSFSLNFLTGQRLDIGEIGWDSATFYNSDEVKEISNALNVLDYTTIAEKYSAGFFNEKKIHPSGNKWADNDTESFLEKLKELSKFINEANSKNLEIYRVLV